MKLKKILSKNQKIKPKLNPKRLKIKPKVKLSFKTKLPQNQRLAFNIQYKQKGKIKELKTKLPLNLALSKAQNLVDNSLSKSLRLVISGITTRKDKKGGSGFKFRQRRTLYSLDIVEKNKYSIDTKGEKKGLTLNKLLKNKKKRL